MGSACIETRKHKKLQDYKIIGVFVIVARAEWPWVAEKKDLNVTPNPHPKP